MPEVQSWSAPKLTIHFDRYQAAEAGRSIRLLLIACAAQAGGDTATKLLHEFQSYLQSKPNAQPKAPSIPLSQEDFDAQLS
jgi:hypothetical protein